MIVVLHHGMWGWDAIRWGPVSTHYWNTIDDAIAAAGYDVIVTRVHPSAGVRRRARELHDFLTPVLNRPDRRDEPVILLGHSMGGMDARYLVSNVGLGDRVAAVVTVGTGHRGSPYYDWIVDVLDCAGQLRAIDQTAWDLGAVWDSTTAGCARLNDETPDVRGIRYYSVAGVCAPPNMPLWLLPGWQIIRDRQGDNDGRISRASARWGRDLGVWPGDHFRLINWRTAVLPGDPFGDVTPRYLDLLAHVTADLGAGATLTPAASA